MLDLALIKLLLINIYYNTYNKYIYNNINNIKYNNKYIYKVFISLKELKDKYSKEENSVEELETMFKVLYPVLNKAEQEFYDSFFTKLSNYSLNKDLVNEYCQRYFAKIAAEQIATTALGVCEGTVELESLYDRVDETKRSFQKEEKEEVDFLDADLEKLHANLVLKPGLRWRLNTLNKSLGSLRKGNFGFIAARPEVGKTAFITSEVSHMVSQVENCVLHINNEEANESVMFRYYMAVLGKSKVEILANIKDNQTAYLKATDNRIKIYGRPFAQRKEIERILTKYNPSLIIIDNLDKVPGFQADRNDLELKAKYQWARELAKYYGPVIGVSQSGGTGENKRYLDMNDIDSSHTGKQGEADWILGIGRISEEGYEYTRWLSLMKNKLLGDEDTIPELRHLKAHVRIKPEWSRYEDAENF